MCPKTRNLGETNHSSIGGVRSNEKRGGRYRPAGRTRALEVFGSAIQFFSRTAQASQGTDNKRILLSLWVHSPDCSINFLAKSPIYFQRDFCPKFN